MVYTFILASLLGLFVSQTTALQCAIPTSDGPLVTMQHTPSMPTQIPPISTVYGVILTSYLNVVDCDYVMVENVDSNPAQIGQFTEKKTVSALTVYRVGCMPVTTAVSRRSFPEHDMFKPLQPRTALPGPDLNQKHENFKRTNSKAQNLHTVLSLAEHLASGIDPSNENITVRDFNFLRQINTALFALNVVSSGLPLDQMCEYMRDAGIIDHLDDSLIDAGQASNIICFAAEYGLYFGESNEQLLSDLASLEYAIQVRDYAAQTLQQLCENLDYTAASFLGIDTDGIRTFICNGTAGASHTISSLNTSTTMPMTTGNSDTTSTPLFPTPSSGTGSGAGMTSGIIFGTDGSAFSSATSAAGTVAPWYNTTVTATADVTTVTTGGELSSPATPAAIAQPFYNPSRLRRNGVRRHGHGIF